jgi:predicted SnoaL-like aldol condensation-catalyzing enzyme
MTNKQIAEFYLKAVTSGRIDQAYDRYVDMSGRHHNIFTAAGFPALRAAMKENDTQFPNKELTILHIAESDDFVMLHSRVTIDPEKPDFATCHVLKFKNGKIIEMWDISQQGPIEGSNKDGQF